MAFSSRWKDHDIGRVAGSETRNLHRRLQGFLISWMSLLLQEASSEEVQRSRRAVFLLRITEEESLSSRCLQVPYFPYFVFFSENCWAEGALGKKQKSNVADYSLHDGLSADSVEDSPHCTVPSGLNCQVTTRDGIATRSCLAI